MKADSVLRCIQKKYQIIYTNLTYYNKIYYADIGIDLAKSSIADRGCHYLTEVIYATGADEQKQLAILKSLIEAVERIIFVSAYFGPVDFIENEAYVTAINEQKIPLTLVSPNTGRGNLRSRHAKKNFTTKGLACHPQKDVAIALSKLEFYEQYLYTLINSEYLQFIGALNIAKLAQQVHEQLITYQILLIYYKKMVYCTLWHASAPNYLLGSACSNNAVQACKKAFIEANGKWEKISKCFSLLTDIADHKIADPILPGLYIASKQQDEPVVIRRHHQLLSELQINMFQSI